MGVPLLFTWLKRRFASCFLPSNSCPEADCLYIDVNGLVYQSAAITTATEVAAADVDSAVLRKLFDILDDIIFSLVRPRSLVYLAVDGISPMGKLSRQRARRRRQQRGGSGRVAVDCVWDNNAISVGTPFMSRLTDALHFYCASRTERINAERLRTELQRVASEGDEEKEEVEVEVRNTTATDVQFSMAPIVFVVDDVWRPGEGENKIADAIRRFRSQSTYDPNTTHVICSSDTDVTVCSLILHEPRMYVLRYEYSAASNNKNNNNSSGGGGGGGGSRGADKSGGWLNCVGNSWTSTFFSIYAFRERLRTILRLNQCTNESADEADCRRRQFERALHDVIFMLLLFGNDFLPSVGCRIEEGFLDDLLELLATDFISRNRSIVDPVTNTIQFDAARYALDSLAEMLSERSNKNGLCVYNGAEGATDWGFTGDALVEQKQAIEEAEVMPQCYAYWTMLQWSLQNSAGVVKHWGCYYPYATAPPLHLLRKYCGTLSYDALMKLARKRSHKRRGNSNVECLADDVDVAAETRGSAPADVLVQLLVLLPARSSALLPLAIRNAYAEIEPIVAARLEQIDFAAIEAWCEKKRAMFTEEERTRFCAYALAAGPKVLAREAQGAVIRGDELLFVADWDAEGFAAEIRHAKTAKYSKATEPLATEETSGTGNKALLLLTNTTTSAPTFSFFGGHSSRKRSAAVAALSMASKRVNVPTFESDNKDTVSVDRYGIDGVAVDDVLATADEIHRHRNLAEILCGRGFTLTVAPITVLGDNAIIKSVGSVVGDAFVCGQYTSLSLSRHLRKMRVRLRWRVASRPLPTHEQFVPDLLPGCVAPPSLLPSRSAAGKAGVKQAMAVSTDHGSDEQNNGDGQENSLTRSVVAELERKKEIVRRRLEALQKCANDTRGKQG